MSGLTRRQVAEMFVLRSMVDGGKRRPEIISAWPGADAEVRGAMNALKRDGLIEGVTRGKRFVGFALTDRGRVRLGLTEAVS